MVKSSVVPIKSEAHVTHGFLYNGLLCESCSQKIMVYFCDIQFALANLGGESVFIFLD